MGNVMEEKNIMLETYMKANIVPILVDFKSSKDFNDSVIIPANIDVKELDGHYEGTEYLPPKWYSNLKKVLVIDNIDTLPKEEQLKFGEILEYRKVSTFELPKDCVVILTVKEINKVSVDVLSLVAII